MPSKTDSRGGTKSSQSPSQRTYDSSSNTWRGNGVTSFSSDGSQSGGKREGTYALDRAPSRIGWVPVATKVVTPLQPSGRAGAAGSGQTGTTGPGAAQVVAGKPTTTGTGPGAALVATGPVPGPATPVLETTPVGGPRRPGVTQLGVDSPSLLMPVYAGGNRLAMDRGWSNAADAEDRWGDGEFLSPTWFYAWGVAGADAWENTDARNGGPLKTGKIQQDLHQAPGVVGGWARDFGSHLADRIDAANDPFGPDFRSPGFRSGGF